MKHIKIAFVLLAAIFLSLSSFKSNGKAKACEGEVQTFEFLGSPGVDEYNAAYWAVSEPIGCTGDENQICQIRLASDNIDCMYPDPTVLSDLLAEAATQDPEIFLAGEYNNGKVIVFHE